jgi:hypothetical protein
MVRDTTNRDGGKLEFPVNAWHGLLAAIRNGKL